VDYNPGTLTPEFLDGLPRPVLVSWVVECAARVLPIFEDDFPDDRGPRAAIEAATAWVECPCEAHALAAKDAYGGVPWDIEDSARYAAEAAEGAADCAAASGSVHDVRCTPEDYAAWGAGQALFAHARVPADAVRMSEDWTEEDEDAAWADAYHAETRWQIVYLAELLGRPLIDSQLAFIDVFLRADWQGTFAELLDMAEDLAG